MLDTTVTVDDDYHLFEPPGVNNHGYTATSSQILFGSDTLKCQHKNPTHTTGKKLPPSGNEYNFFKLVVKIPMPHSVTNNEHCLKLLTPFLILNILNSNVSFV